MEVEGTQIAGGTGSFTRSDRHVWSRHGPVKFARATFQFSHPCHPSVNNPVSPGTEARNAGSSAPVGARDRAALSALCAVEWLQPFGEPSSYLGFGEFTGGSGEHEVDGVVGGDLEAVSVEDAEHGE